MASETPAKLARLQVFLVVLVLLSGFASSLLWMVDPFPWMAFWQPSSPIVSVNLILGGFVFLFDHRNRPGLVKLFAVILLLLSAYATLVAFMRPSSYLVFVESVFRGQEVPTYPTPFSCLYLLGLGVFILSCNRSIRSNGLRLLASFFLVTNGALVGAAFFVFLMGIEASSGIMGLFQVYPAEGIYFFLLFGLSCLMHRRTFKTLPQTSASQNALLAAYGVGLTFIMLMATNSFHDREIIRERNDILIQDIQSELYKEFFSELNRMRGAGAKWLFDDMDDPYRLRALWYLGEVNPAFSDFYLIREGFPVRQIAEKVSLESGEDALRARFPQIDLDRIAAEERSQLKFYHVHVRDGNPVGLAVLPLRGNVVANGQLLIDVRLDVLFQRTLVAVEADRWFSVFVNGLQLFRDAEFDDKIFDKLGSEKQFGEHGLEFRVQVIPGDRILNRLIGFSNRIFWIFGTLYIFMTWILVVKEGVARKNERETLLLNQQLREEIGKNQQIEFELQEANKELKRSNIDLQEFAQVASHDLQEPLRKITAFSQRIRDGYQDVLDERGQDYLERMCRSVDRMAVLIDDLLQFARVQTKGQPLQEVDLGLIFAELVQEVFIQSEDPETTINVPDSFPPVLADPSQMRQLFQNLIGNALKFRRKDVSPEVTVSWQIQAEHLRISVKDNGIGIEAAYLRKIFDIFERLHPRSMYQGTGIGLAICKRIVERHGGELSVKSEPGVGSEFILNILLA